MNIKNNEGLTPLHIALFSSMESAREGVRLLSSNGAVINEKEGNGMTPIDYLDNEYYKIRKLLYPIKEESHLR